MSVKVGKSGKTDKTGLLAEHPPAAHVCSYVHTPRREHMPARFDIDDAEIVALREQNISQRKLADLLSERHSYPVSQRFVAKRLKAAGVVGRRGHPQHRDWENGILPRAVEIVRSYSTPVTLRQLHYRPASESGLGQEHNSSPAAVIRGLNDILWGLWPDDPESG